MRRVSLLQPLTFALYLKLKRLLPKASSHIQEEDGMRISKVAPASEFSINDKLPP